MTEHIVFENDMGIVRYDDDGSFIYHTFLKPVSGQGFQDILNRGLAALEHYGADKWLSDDRLNTAFSPTDVEFAVTDWGPRAAAAGWKYWALIVPDDMEARAGMRDIMTPFHALGVQVALFSDIDKAKAWLRSH